MGVVEGLLIKGGKKKTECINVTSYNFMFIFKCYINNYSIIFLF